MTRKINEPKVGAYYDAKTNTLIEVKKHLKGLKHWGVFYFGSEREIRVSHEAIAYIGKLKKHVIYLGEL